MSSSNEKIWELLDQEKKAELHLERLQAGVADVDPADLDQLLRVIPSPVPRTHYGEYYRDHRDVLPQLEQAQQGGDYQKYFYLHSEDWWFDVLREVRLRLFPDNEHGMLNDLDKDKCALFDALLADTRAADLRNHRNEATDDPWLDAFNATDWSELLEYFNIHGFWTFNRSHKYLNEAEQAEWAALPEKLVIYIGWVRDDASEFAQFWTLDYDVAEKDANTKSNAEVFMTVVAKETVRGYINRHGRQEIILHGDDVDLDALEPCEGPLTDSDPLES